MPDLPLVHLALSAVAFAAGFVDAVAGGGGMLTVPSLLLAVPDARVVLGTNKAQSVWGTAAATLAFARAGALDRSRAGVTFVAAAFGSWLGALGVARLRPELLRPVVLVLLTLAGGFVFARGLRRAPAASAASSAAASFAPAGLAVARAHPRAAAGLIALALGAYDGFFGPGTGTFLLVAFAGVLGDPLDRATANAKVANLASNLAAVATFAAAGHIDLTFAAPMAVAQIAGGLLGAKAALKGGERLVRLGVLAVTSALVARLAWQLLG